MHKTLARYVMVMMLVFAFSVPAGAQTFLKDLLGMAPKPKDDTATIVSGLKEALSVSTDNAVRNVSKLDGYLGNQAIKILLPKDMQKVADVLRKVGMQSQVDEFEVTMNRAAEQAAAKALPIFVDAIKGMSFDDAKGILAGGETAATEFFKRKTSEKIYEEFKPVVSKSLDEVGVTRSYKGLISRYESLLPFIKKDKQSLDLDNYVTNKALDGLFYTVGLEEKKIRTNPAARVTDLLRTVFGK